MTEAEALRMARELFHPKHRSSLIEALDKASGISGINSKRLYNRVRRYANIEDGSGWRERALDRAIAQAEQEAPT